MRERDGQRTPIILGNWQNNSSAMAEEQRQNSIIKIWKVKLFHNTQVFCYSLAKNLRLCSPVPSLTKCVDCILKPGLVLFVLFLVTHNFLHLYRRMQALLPGIKAKFHLCLVSSLPLDSNSVQDKNLASLLK